MKCKLATLILVSLGYIVAEVTVLKNVQILYDKSPKLRIRGSGFDADDHDIVLELGAHAQPLKVDKDYLISKDADGDGVILKLLGNRKWVNIEKQILPVPLILSAVFLGPELKKNLLTEPVTIANVLNTPSIAESDVVIYSSATNELRINGTGFLGAKKVDLYFDPPLVKEVAYEDVTKYPLERNQVILRLRHNYNWRVDEGPLTVMGVDTGGGPVKLGEDGVQIGNVVNNLDGHVVTVEPTSSTQLIYNDEHQIVISGTGFSTVGNTLRFANGILGGNVNYTTLPSSVSSISLRITPGSFWRKNSENLPGALTLLAVNTGDGFVAVGPNNAGKGRDVAMVFDKPTVFSANIKLFRTHSHELHIKGSGFHENENFETLLKFEPMLIVGEDYTIKVISRSELEITLVDGRAWRKDAGSLQLVGINTRGDSAGWVTLPGDGVHVAEVVDDVDAQATGGVEVFPMGIKVYQSQLNQKIVIAGTGFKEGMTFSFEPEMKIGSDYEMIVETKNKAVLSLKNGKKWRIDAGFIIAKVINIDKKTYKLAGNEGIRVAIVLADPVISSSKDTYHESQSKLVVISGSGFTNVADTRVTIRPTLPGAYKVLGVLEDALRIQLKPDQDWLPSFMSLTGEDDTKRIAMQVFSIDTGAGEIIFTEPVTVGYIVKDRESVVCDDSCEFAFDGVCDDGTEPNDQYYYQNYNNYMDDDLGGFYGDPEKGGSGAYGVAYDDYYMENEDYVVSACVEGTDCTDCGGVDAIIDYSKPLDPESGLSSCTNTCIYPRDGVCDDPRGTKYCELGTDCQDCGPVGNDNFTRSDDDGWWDDDDDYWSFNDVDFTTQTAGLNDNRHHVKTFKREETPGAAQMFLVVLEGMVYTVGAIFLAAALYLANRWYKGQSIPFLPDFDSDSNAQRQFELAPSRRMPLTPDVIRT